MRGLPIILLLVLEHTAALPAHLVQEQKAVGVLKAEKEDAPEKPPVLEVATNSQGTPSAQKVVPPQDENVYTSDAPGVGGWGGLCTCPNGGEYWVGDLIDGCKSGLACFGGVSGKCNEYEVRPAESKRFLSP